MKNSFKELKLDELVAKRAELRKKYFDFRFHAVVGHVEWIEFARVPRMPAPGEIVHVTESWQEAGGGGAVAADAVGAAITARATKKAATPVATATAKK